MTVSKVCPRLSLLGLVACAIAGCGSTITISTAHDPEASFTQFRTYDWLQQPDAQAKRPHGVSPRIARRIERTVERTLEIRGYRKTTSRDPDFLVNYFAFAEEKIDVQTVVRTMGELDWYAGTEDEVRQWREGTLILEILDTRTQQLVWRGLAQGAVDQTTSLEKREAKIDEAVSAMLEHFPPDEVSSQQASGKK